MLIVLIVFIAVLIGWYVLSERYEYYMENDPDIVRLKLMLYPVFPEIDYVRIIKSTDASYTIDKSKIYLCTEHNGERYDDNMMTYVILHELAHTLTAEIGHGVEFRQTFETLLSKAQRNGLYDPNRPRVENYCKG